MKFIQLILIKYCFDKIFGDEASPAPTQTTSNRMAQAASGFSNQISTTIESEIATFRQHGQIGNKLKQLGEYIQTIEPTSVNNERAFSVANLLLTVLRLNLAPEKADIILFLNQNLK